MQHCPDGRRAANSSEAWLVLSRAKMTYYNHVVLITTLRFSKHVLRDTAIDNLSRPKESIQHLPGRQPSLERNANVLVDEARRDIRPIISRTKVPSRQIQRDVIDNNHGTRTRRSSRLHHTSVEPISVPRAHRLRHNHNLAADVEVGVRSGLAGGGALWPRDELRGDALGGRVGGPVEAVDGRLLAVDREIGAELGVVGGREILFPDLGTSGAGDAVEDVVDGGGVAWEAEGAVAAVCCCDVAQLDQVGLEAVIMLAMSFVGERGEC